MHRLALWRLPAIGVLPTALAFWALMDWDSPALERRKRAAEVTSIPAWGLPSFWSEDVTGVEVSGTCLPRAFA